MEKQRRVVCAENEELVEFMWKKRQEMAERPKGISESIDKTLQKAYSNVCNSKIHVRTLSDLSKIKGVGKWILRLMKEFFEIDSGTSEHEELPKKGKKCKATKRYVPQKNSVAYALLITLYRGTASGADSMCKAELIDAAEASGLSRVPIRPELGKGKSGQFGNSPREWYSGWSSMKMLITKGLVAKSSSPAKYMLTEEGRETARECLSRSGLVYSTECLVATGRLPNVDPSNIVDLEYVRTDVNEGVTLGSVSPSLQKKSVLTNGVTVESVGSSLKKKSVVTKGLTLGSVSSCSKRKSVDVPPEYLDRFFPMGYTTEQILCAFTEVSATSQNKEISSLWPAVLCHLREKQVYSFPLESHKVRKEGHLASSNTSKSRDGYVDLEMNESSQMESDCSGALHAAKSSCLTSDSSFTLGACSSTGFHVYKRALDGSEPNLNVLAVPPLRFGEKFAEAYEIVLILDEREHFASRGSRSKKIIENIRSQFKIQIEVRRLPVGDGIWIARDKQIHTEYVLDFVVERKNVDDLHCSIRDNRYRDQKLRLLRCGLKKLIYLVEGDPNSSEASESIKTACFTTEILEGFDVQRTSGLGDTLRKYGYLTHAITQYYHLQSPEDQQNSLGVCPTYGEFITRCQNMDKMTVGDVFAIQLMQVPQVTEELAIAVLDLYPTLLSLARAYSLLEGDISAQQEMLKKQSNNMINSAASKNIFKLVWGS